MTTWLPATEIPSLFSTTVIGSPMLPNMPPVPNFPSPVKSMSDVLIVESLKGAGVGAIIGIVVSLVLGGISLSLIALGAMIEAASYALYTNRSLKRFGTCPTITLRAGSGCLLAFMLWLLGLLFVLLSA